MGSGGFTQRRELFRTLFVPMVLPAPPIGIRKINERVRAFFISISKQLLSAQRSEAFVF